MKTFEPQDLIQLPKFSTASALELGGKLIAAIAAEPRLPQPVSKQAARIKRAHRNLAKAARDRVNTDPLVEERRNRLRMEENAAWTSFHHLILGWARVQHEDAAEQREAAARLEAALFGDGQGFARQRFGLAWVEADQRLKLLEERNLEDSVHALGGELFLDSVRRTHEASAEVLGMTKRKAAVVQSAAELSTREVLDEFRNVLREYALQVSAHALSSGDAKSLAARLLAPLSEVQPARKRSRALEMKPEPSPGGTTPPPIS